MKRLALDLSLVAALAALPFAAGAGFEAKRMAILAGVYAAIALASHLRLIAPPVRRAADLTFGIVLLSLAWLESFPAWNHSTEIGLYIAFGAAAVVGGAWRHAPR